MLWTNSRDEGIHSINNNDYRDGNLPVRKVWNAEIVLYENNKGTAALEMAKKYIAILINFYFQNSIFALNYFGINLHKSLLLSPFNKRGSPFSFKQ